MPEASVLDIHVARSDGETTVRLAGELDLMSCGALSDRLSGIAPTPRTVLDLNDITFMDSTGLRALWLFHQVCASDGSQLVLRRPSAAVNRVLDVTGLRSIFTITP
jgi:anti-anti-sigma factor